MCLFPKLLRNPHFKERWFYEDLKDAKPEYLERIAKPLIESREIKHWSQLFVPVGCGKCIECLKKKANEWRTRLMFEIKEYTINKPIFVTLTFSNQELDKLEDEFGIHECNAIATIAMRRFLERVRKKEKRPYRHFFVTELGQKEGHSNRIHMHGIIWTNTPREQIQELWKYGHIDFGDYCNEKSINYIVKYIFKIDTKHPNYIPKILCSPGIGASYCKSKDFELRKYNGENTNDNIRLPSGKTVSMPIYYRNKRYSDEEKIDLWYQKIQKHTRWVMGTKISIKDDEGIEYYNRVLKKAQELNKQLGYGDDSNIWKKCVYNTRLKEINKK